MQRWIPILAVVLALQLAVAAGLSFRGHALAAAAPEAPLVAGDLAGVDKIVVDGPSAPDEPASGGKAGRLEIVKRDGLWKLPDDYGAPADESRVAGLLQRIGALRKGFPVATSEASFERFKVAENRYERRLVLSTGDKAVATLYLGTSPGVRKSNARTADDPAVYPVELGAFELPTESDRWLDTKLLGRDARKLKQIKLASAGSAELTLVSSAPVGGPGKGADWQASGLPPGKKLDEKQVAALTGAIARLEFDQVLGTEPKPEWQQERPELRLDLTAADGKRVTWTLSKPAQGDFHVLKASDQPWYVELKTWNAKPLLDAATADKLLVADSGDSGPSAGQPAAPIAPSHAAANLHAGSSSN